MPFFFSFYFALLCQAHRAAPSPIHPSCHAFTHPSIHPSTRTFLQVSDPVVQGGECGLHSVPLVAVVPGADFGLLQRVDPGQNLSLHVVDLVLQQILQAVGLDRAVATAVLLHVEDEKKRGRDT